MEGFKRKETRAWKEIFDKLDSFITLPSVLYNEDGHVVAIRPDEYTYLWLKRKLSSYFYNAAGLLNGQLYEVPNVPVFDKDGLDPSVAYTPHDYQILCACYRDEVETVLKYFTRIAKIFPVELQLFWVLSHGIGLILTRYGLMFYYATYYASHNTPCSSFPSGVEEEEEEAPKPPERPKGAGSSISQAGGEFQDCDHKLSQIMATDAGLVADDSSDDEDDHRSPSPPRRPHHSHHHGGGSGRGGGGGGRGRRPRRGHGDPDDSGPDGNDDGPETPRRPRRKRDTRSSGEEDTANLPRFDLKLKIDIVPTWDGNINTLARWIMKVNQIAKESRLIAKQLGAVVPRRLRAGAENWYYSLPEFQRDSLQKNWSLLKEAIGHHYMNKTWLDKQKSKANRAKYRDSTAPRETPSDYYIRKLELLEFVYDYSDSELI
ncbi:hypothetical protein EVJ58_g11143, partial [Rhodofomes roseus]